MKMLYNAVFVKNLCIQLKEFVPNFIPEDDKNKFAKNRECIYTTFCTLTRISDFVKHVLITKK